MCESLHGESQGSGGCGLPAGQLPSLGDGKEVAEVYRELEENVRFMRAFCKQRGHRGWEYRGMLPLSPTHHFPP